MKTLPIYVAAALWLACAGAVQAEDAEYLTGSDLLQDFNDGGVTRLTSLNYTIGILEALHFYQSVCMPKDRAMGDMAETVIYTIGAHQEMQNATMHVAVITAAWSPFPCDE